MVTKYILQIILHYNLIIWICTSPVKLRFSQKHLATEFGAVAPLVFGFT